MRARLAILIAWVLGGPAAAFADPAYLPPFLHRVPAVGDRWDYAAAAPFFAGSEVVEVVEVAESEDGWRYLVEHHREHPPGFPLGGVPPVTRTEWFLRMDGSIWRGDVWLDGEAWIDLRKPLSVIRRLPRGPFERSRFGHLSGPKKRRGWIYGWPTGASIPPLPGSRVAVDYALRLAHPPPGSVGERFEDGGKRRRPTLTVRYDSVLGRVAWAHAPGLLWSLVSAEIDGATYEP